MDARRTLRLQRLLRVHVNWLTYRILGSEYVSPEYLDAMEELGLELGSGDSLVEQAFFLGRMKALRKSSDYKRVDLIDLRREMSTPLTSIEEAALEEIHSHAIANIHRIAEDVTSSVMDYAADSSQEEFHDSVKEGSRVYGSYASDVQKSFASKLQGFIKKKFGIEWKRLVVTEFHRAKTRGMAAVIASKIGPYSSGGGSSASVSVIPSDTTCPDCRDLYIGSDGNPKLFKLNQLISAGSNKDRDHKKVSGRHIHWSPTLPPSHPHCACTLTFIPPGMGWVDGRLTVVDTEAYGEGISKAVDTGSMSATIKPPGAGSGSPRVPAATASVGNISLGGAGGSAGGGGGGGGQDVEYDYWNPQSKGGPPPEGQGWDPPEEGRTSYRRPKGMGGTAFSLMDENPDQFVQQEIERAKSWSKEEKPPSVIMDHLQNGQLTTIKDTAGGMNGAWHVTVSGGGGGCLKSAQTLHMGDLTPNDFFYNGHYTCGIGTIPPFTQPLNEKSAYNIDQALGFDLTPPTVLREADPRYPSVSGVVSLQHWQYDLIDPIGNQDIINAAIRNDRSSPEFDDILDIAEDKDKLLDTLKKTAIFDILINSQDRHLNNILFSKDFSSFKTIDNGVSFGEGTRGLRSFAMKHLIRHNIKLTLDGQLADRLEASSYGDIKRSLPDLKDWQQGQQFLRGQFMLHMQKSDGEINKEFFLSYMHTYDGDDREAAGNPALLDWGKNFAGATSTWDHHKKNAHNRELPFHAFEDFAIEFIEHHKANPSSPHHEAAKEMEAIGVLRGSKAAVDLRGEEVTEPYHKIKYEKEMADEIRGSTKFSFESGAPATAESKELGDLKARLDNLLSDKPAHVAAKVRWNNRVKAAKDRMRELGFDPDSQP